MLDLPLTFLHRPANPAVRHPWLLALMHGVGSNEHDLFSLVPQIPEHFHVLSLRAQLRMGPGAFAWFDFSVDPQGGRSIDEAQEAHSRALLEQALPSAADQLGVAPGRVCTTSLSGSGSACGRAGGVAQPANHRTGAIRTIGRAIRRASELRRKGRDMEEGEGMA